MFCSVCLRFSEKTFSISNGQGLIYGVLEIIEKHLNVKIQTENVDEQCMICADCWTKLKDFHDYYEYVAKVHMEHYELLEKESVVEEKEPNIGSEINFQSAEVVNIKEECIDEIEEIHFGEPEEIVVEFDHLQQVSVEDNISEDPVVDNKKGIKTKAFGGRKRGRPRKPSKTETDSNAEEDEAPKQKCKRRKNQVQLKKEQEENECIVMKKEEHLKEKHGKDVAKKPRKRIGYALLQENENLIKKHIKMSCQECTFIAPDFQSLVGHYRQAHPDVRPHIKCCERKLDCPSDILQHAHYHEDPEIFKCKECDRKFINRSGLRDHCLQYHEPEENLSFACDKCPRRFARRNLLEHHHAKHIPKKERSFFCEICTPKRAFANEYILQIHIKNRHTKESNICHVCAKEIRDKQAYEKHVRLHFEASGPRVKCPREGCDSWLKDKDNLRQHLRRFHDPQQYECPQCGRICKNKNSLTSHLKTTHTTILYNCEECQKSFKSQQTLKEHMAGHTGEPLYNCTFCTRTFNSKANMYSHKKKAHPIEWEEWHRTKKGAKK